MHDICMCIHPLRFYYDSIAYDYGDDNNNETGKKKIKCDKYFGTHKNKYHTIKKICWYIHDSRYSVCNVTNMNIK